MVVPAGLYLVINAAARPASRRDGRSRWRPTSRSPWRSWRSRAGRAGQLRAFLLTLAIVDDLGAILVIAIVFTEHVALLWLLGALAVAGVWWMLQRRRIRGWYL